jgi:alpha-glucosidase
VASAIVFTSALLVYGGHPQTFLDSPAVEILRHVPATWDETLVLPPSEIGEVAVLARRSGRDWFLAAVNGAERRTVRIIPAFLGPGRYSATTARDDAAEAGAMKVETSAVSSGDAITFDLRPGGGFAARLVPAPGGV